MERAGAAARASAPAPGPDAGGKSTQQLLLETAFPLISNLRSACELLRAENGDLCTSLEIIKRQQAQEREQWAHTQRTLQVKCEALQAELRTLRGMHRIETMGSDLRELRVLAAAQLGKGLIVSSPRSARPAGSPAAASPRGAAGGGSAGDFSSAAFLRDSASGGSGGGSGSAGSPGGSNGSSATRPQAAVSPGRVSWAPTVLDSPPRRSASAPRATAQAASPQAAARSPQAAAPGASMGAWALDRAELLARAKLFLQQGNPPSRTS
jgi:hypothetical protein